MKKNAKKIGLCALSGAAFLAYFALSLSCASSSKQAMTAGSEISVNFNQETENLWKDYDIFVASEEKSPSRILKVVPKKDSKNAEDSEELETFFVISNPGDNEVVKEVKSSGISKKETVDQNLVTSSELVGKIFISEDDARQAVEFINQIERNYRESRSGDGVLNKFEVKKVWTETETETVWEKTSEAVLSTGLKLNQGESKTKTSKIEKEQRLFFIQHSTAFGKDEILYSAGFTVQNLPYGQTRTSPFPPVVVTLEQILAVRDALSK